MKKWYEKSLKEIEIKKIYFTFSIILIFLAIILIFYFNISSVPELSILDSDSKLNINTSISKTSINKIFENDKTITYRIKWLARGSTDSTCVAKKSFNLKFSVSDYEELRDKPRLPNNVPNQFDVDGELVLTGIKTRQYPCEDNEQFILTKNLIKEQNIVCDLVGVNGKPIISCSVNVLFKSQVPVNYYGDVDGYADVIFEKEVLRWEKLQNIQ